MHRPCTIMLLATLTLPLGAWAEPWDSIGRSVRASVQWHSSDAAAATVSSTGLVTRVGVGAVTITASSEGLSGTATVLGDRAHPFPWIEVAIVCRLVGCDQIARAARRRPRPIVHCAETQA